jgi:hypothetical protein
VLKLILEEADLKSLRVAYVSAIISFYDTCAINRQLVASLAIGTPISSLIKTHIFEIKVQSFRVQWT